ncbi:MAG: peptidoglycan recognition family protein [Pseudomonadota bacterium]|nr:peptidoglycan recognition family protein [Pseudomonadota bacterium]
MNQTNLISGPANGGKRRDIFLWVTTKHASAVPPARVKVQEMIINQHQIIRRYTWGTQAPKYKNLVLDWNYTAIAIHHSGNKGMKKPVEIESYHMNDQNGDDVGYHYLIHPEGKIYEGREIVYKGAHISLKNTGKIGILMLGDYDEQWWDVDDELTEAHLSKLKSLMTTLKSLFPTIKTLGGHREFISKKNEGCPGNLLMNKMDNLRKEFQLNAP